MITATDTLALLLARRSIRRFTVEDVSPEHEQALIDAAFAAPSADNTRPWHFVFVRDPETRRRLKGLHRWTWMVGSAPLAIAVLGNEARSTWWIEDCAAATENILLMAAALGLGAVWCGMREDADAELAGSESACRDVLGVPPGGWRVLALIAVGHPAEVKPPRSQRQVSKISYERFGRRYARADGQDRRCCQQPRVRGRFPLVTGGGTQGRSTEERAADESPGRLGCQAAAPSIRVFRSTSSPARDVSSPAAAGGCIRRPRVKQRGRGIGGGRQSIATTSAGGVQ